MAHKTKEQLERELDALNEKWFQQFRRAKALEGICFDLMAQNRIVTQTLEQLRTQARQVPEQVRQNIITYRNEGLPALHATFAARPDAENACGICTRPFVDDDGNPIQSARPGMVFSSHATKHRPEMCACRQHYCIDCLSLWLTREHTSDCPECVKGRCPLCTRHVSTILTYAPSLREDHDDEESPAAESPIAESPSAESPIAESPIAESPPASPPPCKVCGSNCVSRTGQYGLFWGCTKYPRCKGKGAGKPESPGNNNKRKRDE